MDINILTPEDLAVLKGIVYRERIKPKNSVNRGAVPGYPDSEPTTEVYIAKVPPSGIPALTETASNANDIPGARDCTIYRILLESGTPRLRSIGSIRTVYNLYLNALDPTTVPWAVVMREKFGSWLAVSGFSSAGTGTSADDFCGHLILDCPGDTNVPGTGSAVTGGYASICNEGEIVPTTLYLTLAYGTASVTVALVTVDGANWKYLTPTVNVGTCGTNLQLVEAVLTCNVSGWDLSLALNIPSLTAFANNGDFPSPSKVTSIPFHYTTTSFGKVTTACGFEYLDISITE